MTLLDLVDHLPALPEVLLLLGACVVMIADLYSGERRRLGYYLTLGTLASCVVLTFYVLGESEGTRYYIFHGLFVSDVMSHLLKLACYMATWAALVYSRQWLIDRNLFRGEFLTVRSRCSEVARALRAA